MKILVLFAIVLCTYAADVKEEEKEKRQTDEGHLGGHLVYRAARKQEQVAPVEEHQEEEKPLISRSDDEYRPGQVFSVNAQELLELQPERKGAVNSKQQLQQLYSQQDQKQDLQQYYFIEPQVGRQVRLFPIVQKVALHPSHAVITRPEYSSNGGEASVGAALAVSDTGANSANSFDQDFLTLLGQGQLRQDESRLKQENPRSQTYSQPLVQSAPVQSVAPQYQQVDRYVSKSNKKSPKAHTKSQSIVSSSQIPTAPQQYLIETTNVQQPQQHKLQERQHQQIQYHPAPQQQRLSPALQYTSVKSAPVVQQQGLYDSSEIQGLKVVEAPKLQETQHQEIQQQHQERHQHQYQQEQQQQQHHLQQQQQQHQQQQHRPQIGYRLLPQYSQADIHSKQYRILEVPRAVSRLQPVRQEHRLATSNLERPLAYAKHYPEPEKQRSVKIYDSEQSTQLQQQQLQVGGDQYYLRPVYRQNEQRSRYELSPTTTKIEQQRIVEQTNTQPSNIYVNKNLTPRKVIRPQPILREQNVKTEQTSQELPSRLPHASNVENVNIEQHGQTLQEQRANLPPPKNNKAYTPEEFAALVAAGYAVTPVPVSALSLGLAQSRSFEEPVTSHPVRMIIPRSRLSHSRRHHYLPLRGDDAP